MKSEAQSHEMRRSSTQMATYSYLVAHFALLSYTQGSALEGEKPMSNMMSWIFWDHLRPQVPQTLGLQQCIAFLWSLLPNIHYLYQLPRLQDCLVWLRI